MKTLLVALYPYNGQGLDAWHDHGSGMTYTAAKRAGCEIDFLDMKSLSNDDELRKSIKGEGYFDRLRVETIESDPIYSGFKELGK